MGVRYVSYSDEYKELEMATTGCGCCGDHLSLSEGDDDEDKEKVREMMVEHLMMNYWEIEKGMKGLGIESIMELREEYMNKC
jgi:hypothetical protein